MASPIKNNWTLKKLIQNTYAHQYSKTRFDYRLRDHVKVIRIEKVSVYDGKNLGEAKTKFIISTRSTPQYAPYFTKTDRFGRKRTYQTKYSHEYSTVIQLDSLSIDVPFKGRVGSIGKWDFTPSGASRKVNGIVREGTNVQRGINGDFFFRCEYVWQKEGILFGRSWVNGPPVKMNPRGICFAPKHFLAVVEYLLTTKNLT